MGKSGIDFNEFSKFAREMRAVHSDFDTCVKGVMLELGLKAVGKAKGRSPTDTGALKASWEIGNSKYGEAINYTKDDKGKDKFTLGNTKGKGATLDSVMVVGDSFSITISNPMNYATFLEYGTVRGIKPYFMATVAIAEVQKKIPSVFNKHWERYLKQKGIG